MWLGYHRGDGSSQIISTTSPCVWGSCWEARIPVRDATIRARRSRVSVQQVFSGTQIELTFEARVMLRRNVSMSPVLIQSITCFLMETAGSTVEGLRQQTRA